MPENNKRILMMEDEPIISKVLCRALEREGFEVDSAEDGIIAKEKIDSGKKYDLYLFDIRTPLISGIELYEHLKKNYPGLQEKVVFMTGDCLNTATGLFLEKVKRPYISKPFTPNQILDLIKKAMETEVSAA